MRIEVETNGYWEGTKFWFNGKELKKVKEFNFSVRVGSKPKVQMTQELEGENKFMSFFGQDFQKIDETSKENCNVK